MNTALETWPEGNEYLSTLISKASGLFPAGLLRRKTAFKMAT